MEVENIQWSEFETGLAYSGGTEELDDDVDRDLGGEPNSGPAQRFMTVVAGNPAFETQLSNPQQQTGELRGLLYCCEDSCIVKHDFKWDTRQLKKWGAHKDVFETILGSHYYRCSVHKSNYFVYCHECKRLLKKKDSDYTGFSKHIDTRHSEFALLQPSAAGCGSAVPANSAENLSLCADFEPSRQQENGELAGGPVMAPKNCSSGAGPKDETMVYVGWHVRTGGEAQIHELQARTEVQKKLDEAIKHFQERLSRLLFIPNSAGSKRNRQNDGSALQTLKICVSIRHHGPSLAKNKKACDELKDFLGKVARMTKPKVDQEDIGIFEINVLDKTATLPVETLGNDCPTPLFWFHSIVGSGLEKLKGKVIGIAREFEASLTGTGVCAEDYNSLKLMRDHLGENYKKVEIIVGGYTPRKIGADLCGDHTWRFCHIFGPTMDQHPTDSLEEDYTERFSEACRKDREGMMQMAEAGGVGAEERTERFVAALEEAVTAFYYHTWVGSVCGRCPRMIPLLVAECLKSVLEEAFDESNGTSTLRVDIQEPGKSSRIPAPRILASLLNGFPNSLLCKTFGLVPDKVQMGRLVNKRFNGALLKSDVVQLTIRGSPLMRSYDWQSDFSCGRIHQFSGTMDLRINNFDVGDFGMRVLQSLEFVPRLTALDLTSTAIGACGMRPLLALSQAPGLVRLELRDSQLSLNTAALWPLLSACTSLQHLGLGSNALKPVDASSLAATLGKLTILKHLDVGDNHLSDEGFRKIVQALATSPLQSLDFSANGVGLEAQGTIDHFPNSLRVLNLGWNSVFHATGITLLFDALAPCINLTSIDLRCNLPGHAPPARSEAQLLLGRLHAFPSVQRLNCLQLTPGSALEARGQAIADADMFFLVQAIQTPAGGSLLRHLDLSVNLISAEGLSLLEEGGAFSALTGLETLDLSRNQVGDRGCAILARSLTTLAAVRCLRLDGNRIGADGALSLSPFIAQLETLGLSSNKLGPPGLQNLSLPSATLLTKLDLRFSSIDGEGALVLVQALRRMTALVELKLAGNRIPFEEAMQLAGVMTATVCQTERHHDGRTDMARSASVYSGFQRFGGMLTRAGGAKRVEPVRLDLGDQINDPEKLDESKIWDFFCGDAADWSAERLAVKLHRLLPSFSERVCARALRSLISDGGPRITRQEFTECDAIWHVLVQHKDAFKRELCRKTSWLRRLAGEQPRLLARLWPAGQVNMGACVCKWMRHTILRHLLQKHDLKSDGDKAAKASGSGHAIADADMGRLTVEQVLDVVDREQLGCYLKHALELTSSVKDSASDMKLLVDDCISLQRVEFESLDRIAGKAHLKAGREGVGELEAETTTAEEEDLICPISRDFMRDPVRLSGDEKCYERKCIERHLANKKTSPITKEVLEDWHLTPQPDLLEKIRVCRERLQRKQSELKQCSERREDFETRNARRGYRSAASHQEGEGSTIKCDEVISSCINGQSICITGPPASGKTVTMLKIATAAARAAQAAASSPRVSETVLVVPIFIRAAELTRHATEELLEPNADLVELFITKAPDFVTEAGDFREMLKRLYSCGNVLVLLDGLDEGGSHRGMLEAFVDRQAEKPARNSVFIISTREYSFRESRLLSRLTDFTSWQIQPLSKVMQRDLVKARIVDPEKVEEFQTRLEMVFSTAPEFSGSPFFLGHMIAVGNTPLHWAAHLGHADSAKAGAEAGADKEAKDKLGYTTLHVAAQHGHADLAKALVEAGADKEAKDKFGATPLHRAALNGHADAAKALVEAGADKEAKDEFGNTPLHLASLKGHAGAAKALVEAGADKEAKDKVGRTPLHWAALNGHADAAKALMEAGADKEAKNEFGHTPLHLASLKGHADAAKVLVEAGADKEAKDKDGRTPLHLADLNGHADAAKALMEAGADKEAKNEAGHTPLDLASELAIGNDKQQQLIELLQGAKPRGSEGRVAEDGMKFSGEHRSQAAKSEDPSSSRPDPSGSAQASHLRQASRTAALSRPASDTPPERRSKRQRSKQEAGAQPLAGNCDAVDSTPEAARGRTRSSNTAAAIANQDSRSSRATDQTKVTGKRARVSA